MKLALVIFTLTFFASCSSYKLENKTANTDMPNGKREIASSRVVGVVEFNDKVKLIFEKNNDDEYTVASGKLERNGSVMVSTLGTHEINQTIQVKPNDFKMKISLDSKQMEYDYNNQVTSSKLVFSQSKKKEFTVYANEFLGNNGTAEAVLNDGTRSKITYSDLKCNIAFDNKIICLFNKNTYSFSEQ